MRNTVLVTTHFFIYCQKNRKCVQSLIYTRKDINVSAVGINKISTIFTSLKVNICYDHLYY